MAHDLTLTGSLDRLQEQALDYHRMAKALDWLALRWRDRPSLEDAADVVGLSPFHFQRIFTRWAGVSPKTFVAAIAHAEARDLLEEGASVLDAALDTGLSGPSRLHDLFIAQEAARGWSSAGGWRPRRSGPACS
jgi:AraC family transcriptional regulator of adaptative response/methylated-DNA-[protein]-cysteine methyltransferase